MGERRPPSTWAPGRAADVLPRWLRRPVGDRRAPGRDPPITKVAGAGAGRDRRRLFPNSGGGEPDWAPAQPDRPQQFARPAGPAVEGNPADAAGSPPLWNGSLRF